MADRCGPPWMPGKTLRSMSRASSALHRMSAPRGPRRLLWVVVVTTSAYGTGLGWTPPATSPAMWAMSAMKRAPTSAAISEKRCQSMMRG